MSDFYKPEEDEEDVRLGDEDYNIIKREELCGSLDPKAGKEDNKSLYEWSLENFKAGNYEKGIIVITISQ